MTEKTPAQWALNERDSQVFVENLLNPPSRTML